ncbi:TonB-dependent hemoglobin/transferrin/lactoferrin family receptor [Oceanisphaera pacifica]|uniref:TonB-dependent hemoglobin/transferrin/lactoferrin family receptor n=1 Tax=Oceanisphaera pacifica TaxID=2818389 RepID=A0ABS3NIH7_9GAMM|nr:TonB-dependent hemoglobin/transferrin/lactoferrin family receptor [Oceanisphaera pacifica]MBO1520330.1 TonB-dependent hemoglobin/transferrin/lactoferrin family receptor [Oceanisphaera pacifica]
MFTKTLLSASIMLAVSPATMAKPTSFLDETVVTATRTTQAKKDVSSSIESETRQKMDANLVHDVKDALKYTPGVAATGGGRFGISGFNIRGVEGSRVKTMIDGVQQPAPYNPGANEQRSYPNAVEIDTLQAIEVNKGPASTLYGSDAIGGAVLLKTKDPSDVLVTDEDEHRFGLKTSYASVNEEFKNTFTWAMRQGELETLVMATYADGGETKTHGSGADVAGPNRGAANPADSELGNLLGKVYYQVNDDHRVGATVEYYKKQYDEDELSQNGYTIMPGFTYTDNYNEDDRERIRVGVEHQWQINSALADDIDWSFNVQHSNSTFENFDTTGFIGQRNRERIAKDKTLQFDAQFAKLAGANKDHQLNYGVNLVHNDFELNNTDFRLGTGTAGAGNTGVPDAELLQWGVFLQDQMYLLDDKLIVTAGARYDRFEAKPSSDTGYINDFDSNKDDAVTLKLGSVYHLNNNLSVYGQISQGFKAPTAEDLYYFYGMGSIFNPNPNLKAEKSLAYELGLRGQSELASFELASFYTQYSDFIADAQLGVDTATGKDVFTKQNLDEVTIYGAELSSTLYLDTALGAPKGSYAKASLAYADGEEKDSGRSLNSVAPLTSVLGLGIDTDNYGGQINWTLVASKNDWLEEDHADTSGYGVVDLSAYYKPTQDLTLRAGLFNAFDKKYWSYRNVSGSEHGTGGADINSEPGRNWSLVVDYQF